MATLIQALTLYRPRLRLNQTLAMDSLVDWIAGRTGVGRGTVLLVLSELGEALAFFCGAGTPIKLPYIGWFGPSIKTDGRLRLVYRPDPAQLAALNSAGTYKGRIVNRPSIGAAPATLKAMWDAEHPDDPLVLPNRTPSPETTHAER